MGLIGEKGGVRVGQCLKCNLIRALDKPESYVSLYTEGDYYHNKLQHEVGHQAYGDRFGSDWTVAASRFGKLHGCYSLLDVGCANGAFVAYARQQGYDAEGFELNPLQADRAAVATGAKIHTSWDSVVRRYDIVTYHDVIEHVEDPRNELLNVHFYMERRGLLVLDTPDADDERFAQGTAENAMDWHHIRPEQHLWYFTEATLVPLVQRAGFQVIRVDRPIQGKLVVYARKETILPSLLERT